MQSKKYSLIEATTNTTIAFIISLTCGVLVYPLYFPEVKFHQTFELILMFTILSILRGYIIRRFFNKNIPCDHRFDVWKFQEGTGTDISNCIHCNQFMRRITLDEHEHI